MLPEVLGAFEKPRETRVACGGAGEEADSPVGIFPGGIPECISEGSGGRRGEATVRLIDRNPGPGHQDCIEKGTNPHMVKDGAPKVQEVAVIDVHTVETTPSIIPRCWSRPGSGRGS